MSRAETMQGRRKKDLRPKRVLGLWAVLHIVMCSSIKYSPLHAWQRVRLEITQDPSGPQGHPTESEQTASRPSPQVLPLAGAEDLVVCQYYIRLLGVRLRNFGNKNLLSQTAPPVGRFFA